MAREPMPPEDHKSMGQELFAIRNCLQKASLAIATHYGKNSKEARRLFRAVDMIDEARSHLDGRLFAERRQEPAEELADIYYPGRC